MVRRNFLIKSLTGNEEVTPMHPKQPTTKGKQHYLEILKTKLYALGREIDSVNEITLTSLFDSFTSSWISRDRFKGATTLKQKSANLRQVNLTNKMMKSFR